MKAFWVLNSCRNYENGLIPWNRVLEYAIFNGLDSDRVDILYRIVERLDIAYLEWRMKEQERIRAQAPKT